MSRKLRVGVLISGRGSNLQALLDASRQADYPAEIAIVISNIGDAAGLDRARTAGVKTGVIDHKAFASREAFDAEVTASLKSEGVELVCLAGFMRLLSKAFVDGWTGRLVNIHPSLLPNFKGLHPHRQALDAGVRLHGCSVHFVTPEVDAGPIIAQAAVPVLPGDDEDRLAARVLSAEHVLYPMAVKLIAEGRAKLVDGRVATPGENGEDSRILANPAV